MEGGTPDQAISSRNDSRSLRPVATVAARLTYNRYKWSQRLAVAETCCDALRLNLHYIVMKVATTRGR